MKRCMQEDPALRPTAHELVSEEGGLGRVGAAACALPLAACAPGPPGYTLARPHLLPPAALQVMELSQLAGVRLAGGALMSGEDGLERTGSDEKPQLSPPGSQPMHGTRLAGVNAPQQPALPLSPFA